MVLLVGIITYASPGLSSASWEGTFTGLIYNSEDPRPETTGSFRLQVGKANRYEGSVHVFGYRFKIHGTFSSSGMGFSFLIRNRTWHLDGSSSFYGPLVEFDYPTIYGFASLWFDKDGQSIIGRLTYDRIPSLTWTSAVEGYRVAEDNADIPENGMANYTFLLNSASDSPHVPGYGFGSVTISQRRVVRMRGELPDGSKFTSQSEICRGGFWPVLGKMNRGKSLLLGWMGFGIEKEGWLGGDLQWLGRSPGATENLFADSQQLAGVRYQPLSRKEPIFPWTNGELILDSPGYSNPWATSLSFDVRQSWILGDDEIRLSRIRVQKRSGVFSGSFRDPITGNPAQLRGAVLPSAGVAGGYFRGGGNAGWIWIQEHEDNDQSVE